MIKGEVTWTQQAQWQFKYDHNCHNSWCYPLPAIPSPLPPPQTQGSGFIASISKCFYKGEQLELSIFWASNGDYQNLAPRTDTLFSKQLLSTVIYTS